MQNSKYYYEEELDEMLLAHNPMGGRPQKIGQVIFEDGNKCFEISRVEEETCKRYALGYCGCGKKVVIGERRAEVLMEVLRKNGIKQKSIPSGTSLRLKFARMIVRGIKE